MSSTTSSDQRKASSIIVLDWDDTLFPTSVRTSCTMVPGSGKWNAACRSLEDAVIDLLKICLVVAQVQIVSNASMDWITQSMAIYMPNLRWFVERNSIRLISARDLAGDSSSDASIWKTDVFMREILRIQSASGAVNFISVGDGDAELEAARSLRSESPDTVLKCVRLRRRPSMDVMEKQITWLKRNVVKLMDTPTAVEWWPRLPTADLKSLGRKVTGAPRSAGKWVREKFTSILYHNFL